MSNSNGAAFDPLRARRGRFNTALTVLQVFGQVLGLPVVVLVYGFKRDPFALNPYFDWMVPVLVLILTAIPLLKLRLSRTRTSFRQQYAVHLWVVYCTLGGSLVFLLMWQGMWLRIWWDMAVLIWSLLGLLSLYRRISLVGWSPALILVLSFSALILLGTILLMLPRAHRDNRPTQFKSALFTATSAVCVTGLTIEDTGTYWSREGQIIILILIQLGGLGIMTWGAAFALLVRRGLIMREARVLSDLLERDVLDDLRRLIVVIAGFTLVAEAIGAILLSGLWSHLTPGEQVFHSIFHSVSAFCNAGFSLNATSMISHATTWQVTWVLPALIILGGIGFVVVYDVGEALVHRWGYKRNHSLFHPGQTRPRLSLTTKLVLMATVLLLLGGTLGIYFFEWLSGGSALEPPFPNSPSPLQYAWFHSVSARTAGFNSLPMETLNPATRFFIIILMGIGAFPGSTGGGIKTVPIVVGLLTLRSLMRGRDRVEIGFRTIPTHLVYRALMIITLGVTMAVMLTLFLVAVESRVNPEVQFLDCAFEAVSALATVGLSTRGTQTFTSLSQYALVIGMFMGRVGALTLIISLAGRPAPAAYSYPEERVLLG